MIFKKYSFNLSIEKWLVSICSFSHLLQIAIVMSYCLRSNGLSSFYRERNYSFADVLKSVSLNENAPSGQFSVSSDISDIAENSADGWNLRDLTWGVGFSGLPNSRLMAVSLFAVEVLLEVCYSWRLMSLALEIGCIPTIAMAKKAFVLVLCALPFCEAAQEVSMLIAPFVFR